MNVPTITMDREQAKAKLKAYRADTHKDAEQVYSEAAQAYEALAAGTPLLRLSQAIQQAGFFADMRPKLAIARADRREVRFRWSGSATQATYDSDFGWHRGPRVKHSQVAVAMGRQHGLTRKTNAGHIYDIDVTAYALVPMLPADHRPKHGQLRDWFILWEVDQWFATPQTMTAPTDPMLLQHIGGDLYAVLAQWDLSPIEQAILEGAMRS